MMAPFQFDPITNRQLSRRRFLVRSAAGAAGLLTASAWPRFAFGDDPAGIGLIVRQSDPLNAEPPLPALVEEFVTPTKHFYVRNHGPIPTLDPSSYRLAIDGLVDRPVVFSVAELKERFPKADCMATLICAGNRRAKHSEFRKVPGVQWDAGAIGNATWGGVRLSDLLKHCKPKEGATYVWFDGADRVTIDGGTTHFGASIPLGKAMQDDDAPGALVAWEMNGADLTPDHGRPLRTVVPGYIGARSVKWLTRISVSDRPSPNHYVRSAYKVLAEESDLAKAEENPIYRFPVNVAICDPARETELATGMTAVRGYALPTGLPEARIKSIEVSADGGRRWIEARLLDEHVPYCWTRWEASAPVAAGTDRLVARATDTAGGVTPDRVTWNAHGYLYNGWHSVPVRVGG